MKINRTFLDIFISGLLLWLTCFHSFGYQKDSLRQVLEQEDDPETRLQILENLTLETSDLSEAIQYGIEALNIAQGQGNLIQIGDLANRLGIYYYESGNYEKTLQYFFVALSALEELGNDTTIARAYNNIGLIMEDLDRMDECIDYHDKSLAIKERLQDSLGMASSYTNLGLAYQKMQKLDTALQFHRKALLLDQLMENEVGVFYDYSNLGENHFLRKNYDSASYFFEKADNMRNDNLDQLEHAEFLATYGELSLALGKLNTALQQFREGYEESAKQGANLIMRQSLKGLANTYEALGDYQSAFLFFNKYDQINQKIAAQKQAQKIAAIETDYQIQKGLKEIELLKKEAEIKDLTISNTKYTILALAIAILLFIVVVISQYRKNHFKSKTNSILRDQNLEIADKNKDIMNSLAYAKNIQKAIQPDPAELNNLFQDSFIYTKAKDVVSGDFYWFSATNDTVIIAAADCTGHGIPAAFLNVIGNTLLNTIVVENKLTSPGEILKELNIRIKSFLKADFNAKYNTNDDGMDMAICTIRKNARQLIFAGAKRPLFGFVKNEFIEIKGSPYSIGGFNRRNERLEFEEHILEKIDDGVFYLFTDGIVDQFGGDHDKKYMYHRLRTLLDGIHQKPMHEQRDEISSALTEWMNGNDPTDDMLLIGFRF